MNERHNTFRTVGPARRELTSNNARAIESCPECRGYRLESSWCDECGGLGYVTKRDSRNLPHSDVELDRLRGTT
jgi:hypothetical protein